MSSLINNSFECCWCPQGASRLRQLIAAIACTLSLTSCGGVDTAEWTEQVRLSDGGMLEVWRKDRRGSNGFPVSKRGPYVDFELKHAPTGAHWSDKTTHVHVPHLKSFDIIDGVPYLVVGGNWDVCLNRPKTDYAAQFLKWVSGQWVQVPQAEFPVERVLVNLYGRQWGHTTKDDARGLVSWQTKAERDGFNPDRPDTVKAYFERGARRCENHPAEVIQTTRDSSSYGGDPFNEKPPAIKVELEILGENTYEIPAAMRGDRQAAIAKWGAMAADKAREERCKQLLRSEVQGATVETVRQWYLFVEDKTGRNRAGYTGDAICDPNAIWLVDNRTENGSTTLWKYTITGDFVYRISFKRPANPFHYAGIMMSTFKAEDGYLRFEWWGPGQPSEDPYVKRSLQMQIREPH